jgi:protein O-mannosyl-transferase
MSLLISNGLQEKVSKRIFLLLILIILIVSFAVYFNSLFNGFVFDDNEEVLENLWIRDIRYIPEIFSTNFWGFEKDLISNYYRPLISILLMLNYHIFGLEPLGFHLLNVLLHSGVSVLVFLVTMILLRNSRASTTAPYAVISLIAALLFATHPIHTESVAWVSGIVDPAFAFFYLLSFYFYIHGEGSKSRYLFSVVSFFLATLCKETALTLPILLIIYDYSFRNTKDNIFRSLTKYIPYVIAAGVYFVMRFNALEVFAPIKRHTYLSVYQSILNIFPLFSQYIEKLFLPVNLNAFHVFHPIASIFEIKGILSLAVTAAFVILAFIALKKNRMVFFCLSLIVVPLIPVLYIPFVGDNTFAERYLYLPSIGFVILLALFFPWRKSHVQNGIAVFLVVSILSAYSVATASRNMVWKDDYTLYIDMIKKSPDAALPRNLLGHILSDAGWIDHAIIQYQIAISLNPNFVDAHNNLANAFYKKGLLDYAIQEYQIVLSLSPNHRDALNNLSVVYAVRESILSQKNSSQ